MPCSRREYADACEEGARFVFQAAPVALMGNDRGEVKGLRLVRTELGLPDTDGPRPFLLQPGTEFAQPADVIVLALGFDPVPCAREGDFGELAINDWGGIAVDANQMTSIPGVFAGGDIVRGAATVILAMGDGKKAAQAIDKYLAAIPKLAGKI